MFKEIKEFDNLDTVHLNTDLLDKLVSPFKNGDFFFPVGGIIEEGVIKLVNEKSNCIHFVYFREVNESRIELQDYLYYTDVKPSKLEFYFSGFLELIKKDDGLFYPTKTINNKKYSQSFSRVPIHAKKEYMRYSTGLYMVVFGYIHMFQTGAAGQSKKSFYNKKDIVNKTNDSSIDTSHRNTVFLGELPISTSRDIDTFKNYIEKQFTRRTESWTVRGHYRTLKNGKRIFIKAYTKGSKDKITPKSYKFNDSANNDFQCPQ